MVSTPEMVDSVNSATRVDRAVKEMDDERK